MQARIAATIIGGIVTHLLAIGCWYVGWKLFQSDLLKQWVNLILPFGAAVLGCLGGLGFLVVGRWVRQPSTSALAACAVLIAVAAAFGMRFLGYWTLEFDGEPIHRTVGFLPYLEATLGHARMSLSHGPQDLGSIDLGALGYLMEAIQTAAYAAASLGFVMALPRAVRCERCNVAMGEALWGKLRINDQQRFEGWYLALPTEPGHRLAELKARVTDRGKPGAGAIELRYRLVECGGCSAAAVAESGKVHGGKYWAPFKPLSRLFRFDRARTLPPVPPASPAPPQRPSFGRRTTI